MHLSDYQTEDLYTLRNELDEKFDMELNKYSPNPRDTSYTDGLHAPLSAFQRQPPPIFKIVMCGDFACRDPHKTVHFRLTYSHILCS